MAIDAHLAIFGDRCIKSPGVSLDLGKAVKVRHAHEEVCFKISDDHAITKHKSCQAFDVSIQHWYYFYFILRTVGTSCVNLKINIQDVIEVRCRMQTLKVQVSKTLWH